MSPYNTAGLISELKTPKKYPLRRSDRRSDGQSDRFTIGNTALSIASYADTL